METGLSKTEVIAQLTRSTHGNLKQYVPVTRKAAAQDAEFLAHLIAWNQRTGQIRDSKIALPVASLAEPQFTDPELVENSLAHLALLDPRNLLTALNFAYEVKTPQRGQAIRKLVERYLRTREESYGRWERTAIQHRRSMKTLYARYHVKPVGFADRVLFKGDLPAGSMFDAVAKLKDMSAREAAGTILTKRIPFLIAIGALGPRAKEPDLVLALIEQMSPSELVTNTNMLQRLGVKTVPVLKSAYDAALQKVASSKKVTMKTTRAAEATNDEALKEKLRGVQEKQLNALEGVEGDWLVLADKSGSMVESIGAARMIAATLARMIRGKVHLVFFDTLPRYFDATGKDHDAIVQETRMVTAGGGTSIGCGVKYLREKNIVVNGIAIVSDGAEHQAPAFDVEYPAYCKKLDVEPTVYHFDVKGEPNRLKNSPVDMQTFDLRHGQVDFYSLPNLVATMNTRRYGLVDQIMDERLLTLDAAFRA